MSSLPSVNAVRHDANRPHSAAAGKSNRSSPGQGSAARVRTARSLTDWSRFLAPALRGVRANLIPGLVLQLCSLALVIGYYQVDWFTRLLTSVGELKVQYGYAYAAASTCLFAGILPYLVLRLTGRHDRLRPGREAAFFVFYWLYRGLEVDLFYRPQTAWFGDEPSVGVIVIKVLVDQFAYNPLWASPSQMLAFLWKDSGYSLARTRESLRRQSLLSRTALILITTWSVWVPAVAIIYTLPAPLQLPLCNLVACFWCLLLTFISRDTTEVPEGSVPPAPVSV